MKKANVNLIAFMIFTVMVTGCSSTKMIKQTEDLQLDKHATLVMSNNAEIDVRNIYTKEDSVIAVDYYRKSRLKFHKSDIQKIVMTDRSKGAVHGLLFGGAGGLLYGIGYGLASDVDDPLAHPIAAGMITGILSGSVGALTGLVIGSKNIYQFENGDMRITSTKSVSNPGKTVTAATKSDTRDSVDTQVKEPEQSFKSNRQRRSWYLYGEYGYGTGDLSIEDNAMPATDKNGSEAGIGATYEIGLRFKQNLLLGVRVGGLGYDKIENDITNERGLARFVLMATYFPKNKSFFTRAGLGYSLFEYSLKKDDEVFSKNEKHGISGQLGIGYAIWLDKNINLVIGGEISGHLFKNNHSPVWAQITLGIMLY